MFTRHDGVQQGMVFFGMLKIIALPCSVPDHVQFNHAVSGACSLLKGTTITQVNLHFKKVAQSKRLELLEKNRYWYEITEVSPSTTYQGRHSD